MSMPSNSSKRSLADKGMVPLEQVTAVLIKGAPNWTKISPGSFDLCEINLRGSSGKPVGGSVGYKFTAAGENGRPSVIFVVMEAVAAVQLESSDLAEGNNVNNNK
jgi:hypothetical protein